MNKRQRKKKIRQENKKLIESYPFLAPRYWYNDEIIKNNDSTYLDDMPGGWKKAFGKLICEDIKNILVKNNELEDYRILQVKEKFGELRWYDNGHISEIGEIIEKYSHISQFTCVECGKINVPIINEGWIMPMCECCYNRHTPRKIKYGMKPDYNKAISYKAGLTKTFNIKKFSKDGEEIITYDCSDILERMGYLE